MIKGLKKFKEHFKDYKEQYILIGGSACELLMDQHGLDFRMTKDLDVVVCVEALTREFVGRFWEFVKDGGYQVMERGNGTKCFYRFTKPDESDYPYMLEILSRKPDVLGDRVPGAIAPLTVKDDIVSLSAILLDDTYYKFILQLRTEIEDVVIADARCIIPLKARAWIDLTEKKKNGDVHARGDDIKKHKNDIYRLSQLLVEEPLQGVPEIISKDILVFTRGVMDDPIDLRQIKVSSEIPKICARLEKVYCS